MATESNVRQSAQDVRTYRGRTLEEILPQIREELGPDAMILREREGLVGGVGGFFAQRFIEVEARRGDGQSIDIYDDGDEDELGLGPPMREAAPEPEQPLLPEAGGPREAGEPLPGEAGGPREAGEPREAGGPREPGGPLLLEAGEPRAPQEPMDITARRQTPVEGPSERSQPKPFVPPELQRERIIPREGQAGPAPPTRAFERDVFLERLRAASQILPEEDEELAGPSAAAPSVAEPPAPASATTPGVRSGPERDGQSIDEPAGTEAQSKPRRPARRSPQERKPRGPQPRRPAARAKAGPSTPEQPVRAPEPDPTDAWAAAMAALVAEPEPQPISPPRVAAPRTEPRRDAPSQPASGYDAVRQRPPSLRAGLPTGPPATAGAAPAASTPPTQPSAPIPAAMPIAPLELRERREGAIRGLISRLLGGRFAPSALPKPSPPRPIDAAAAAEIAAALSARGASQAWIAQLINSAAAHGSPLSDGLRAAAAAEIARRIVPPPALPVTGAAVAFIGAGGAGKTRCTAALASAYGRESTLGVTVIAIDNSSGARELKRLLGGDGVPVLSLSGERAQRAVETARESGFVIVDTPATTPTDPAAIEALGANLAPLNLDAIFVTLPATLGPQAARRALASFGRLDPSAVAITHADETDQLAVVVEIAIAHRIPLVYFHSGTDHESALSAVEASALAQQLLAT